MTVTRRNLIGGGAALAGAGAIASFGGTAGALDVPLTAEELEALDIPVMLSVTDADRGTLEILVGEQAIEFTDRRLVAKIAGVARKAGN